MAKWSSWGCVAVLMALSLSVFHHAVVADAISGSAQKVEACHMEAFGVHNMLYEISQKAHVVIGLEGIQPRKDKTFVLDFPGGTVADLLNMLTSQSPEYVWEEGKGGVIHVFRNGSHMSLADVEMSYPGSFNKSRQVIWQDIAQRPEVSAWMNANRCSRGEFFNGKEFKGHNDPISITPGNITVARLLDQVAIKSGVGYWAVLQSPPGDACEVSIILW